MKRTQKDWALVIINTRKEANGSGVKKMATLTDTRLTEDNQEPQSQTYLQNVSPQQPDGIRIDCTYVSKEEFFLPEDVVRHILSYVGPDTLLTCSLVCHSWKGCTEENMWVCGISPVCFPPLIPRKLHTPSLWRGLSARGHFTPLCLDGRTVQRAWKKEYIRQKRIQSNWRAGRFQTKSICDIGPSEYVPHL